MHCHLRTVPLCDFLPNIQICTAQHHTFRASNSASHLSTGVTHCKAHACFGCSKPVPATALLQATNSRRQSYPQFVVSVAALLTSVSLTSLCETVEPQDFRRMWLFGIVKSRRWKNSFFVHSHVRRLAEKLLAILSFLSSRRNPRVNCNPQRLASGLFHPRHESYLLPVDHDYSSACARHVRPSRILLSCHHLSWL